MVRGYGHGAVLLECLGIALELLHMVTDDVGLFTILDLIDEVKTQRSGVHVTLVLSIDLNSLVEGIASTVHGNSLLWVANSEILRAIASIKLDVRRSVDSIETDVLALTELVPVLDHSDELLVIESVEHDREFLLLLLHVHHQAEERWT